MLGTYISDHPLYEMKACSRPRPTARLFQLENGARIWPRRAKVITVGGILAEVQLRTTKAGQQYARVVLEDLGGQ